MNYEEKYNKLVNAIKVLQEANPSDIGIRNWVNDNVPELRESEDEKIRKQLLNWFKGTAERIGDDRECFSGITYKSVIAWLEKVIIPSHNDIDSSFIEDIKNVVAEAPLLMQSDKKKMIAWLEKQGEQTSFYSEQNLSNEVGNYDHSKVFQSLYNKPTSWSEEDDKLWKSIIDDTVQENQLDNKQINWLIYLKQRYTWKPSKGQMEALKNACDKSWEPDGLDPLYMLYEDLKKLKGEKL